MVGDEVDSIDPYDFIIIKNISYDDLEIGDVIVFQDQFNDQITLIVHRIVGIHPDGGFQTKGDNPDYNIDPRPVTDENYLGRYHEKITFLKPIANLAINSRGLLFGVISIVLVIILVTEIHHIIKVYHDEKEKKLIEENKAKKEEILNQLKNKIYLEISQENDLTKPKK
jgi:signal peptidase I